MSNETYTVPFTSPKAGRSYKMVVSFNVLMDLAKYGASVREQRLWANETEEVRNDPEKAHEVVQSMVEKHESGTWGKADALLTKVRKYARKVAKGALVLDGEKYKTFVENMTQHDHEYAIHEVLVEIGIAKELDESWVNSETERLVTYCETKAQEELDRELAESNELTLNI